jgi:AAA family ATP:ADP antiporter
VQLRGRLPPGVDGWGVSLRGLMGMVVLGGLLVAGTYFWLQRTVVPGVVAALPPKPKKHKENMSIGESFNFLAKSTYIRDLAALVRNRSCIFI